MTIPNSAPPSVDFPSQQVYVGAQRAPFDGQRPARRGRALSSAIAVYLGGYILVSALTGQLVSVLAGFGLPLSLLPLLLSQLLFSMAVVIFGFAIAPAPALRRLIASVIVLAGAPLILLTQYVTLTGALGAGGLPLRFTLANSFFMTVLLGGVGWMIVCRARYGWLSLIATLVLVPLPYLFALANVESAFTQFVMLFLTGVVGAVLIVAGRPWALDRGTVAA